MHDLRPFQELSVLTGFTLGAQTFIENSDYQNKYYEKSGVLK